MTSERISALRALAHPLRMQMLSLLTARAMSASELSRELTTSQANASYHLRLLARVGVIELVEEATVRGGRVKRYRHSPETDTGVGSEPSDGRGRTDGVYGAIGSEMLRRMRQRSAFTESMVADAELWVDRGTWTEFVSSSVAASTLLHERAVAPGTVGAVRTSTTMVLFEMFRDPGDERSSGRSDS